MITFKSKIGTKVGHIVFKDVLYKTSKEDEIKLLSQSKDVSIYGEIKKDVKKKETIQKKEKVK